MSKYPSTKVDSNGRRYKINGAYNRTEALAVHGADVHPTPSTQWAVLNDKGEPTCSMWLADTDGPFPTKGVCNFRGGDRDCGDQMKVGDKVRIVQQDGFFNGTHMVTTFSQPLPTYWEVTHRGDPPAGSGKDHAFDWYVTRTMEPVS